MPSTVKRPPPSTAGAEERERGRGRPRNLQARDAILRAARDLLHDAGPAAVTMEAVAARAGVGKPTVYRWWPNRHAVTMAALMDGDTGAPTADSCLPSASPSAATSAATSRGTPASTRPAAPGPAPSGAAATAKVAHAAVTARRPHSALAALERQLLQVAGTLASRAGRHVTAMIAAADPDTEVAKAFRHHFVLARRNEGRVLIDAAIQAGELRRGIDVDAALDQIYGAVFFRLLLGHATVDAAFVRALLKQTVRGLAVG
jgi:AcrR family transcriptional regulator